MVQGIMLAAAMGGMAVAVLSLGRNSAKTAKGNDVREELIEKTLEIQTFLNNSDNCYATLNNQANPLAAGAQTDIDELQDQNGQAVYAVNDDGFSDNLFIASIDVLRGAGQVPPNGLPSNLIQMKITFEKKLHLKKNSAGAQSQTRTFYLHGKYTGNNLTGCLGANESAIETILELSCLNMHGTNYLRDTRQCEVSSGLDSFINNTNGTDVNVTDYDYCSLTRAGGEDEWKSSSTHDCQVIPTGAREWALRNSREEARSNYCKMTCFRIGGANQNNEPPDTGGDSGSGGASSVTDDIATAMCNKIIECMDFPKLSIFVCEATVAMRDGYDQWLGLNPATYSTYSQVSQAEEDGDITADATHAATCLAEIPILGCQDPPMTQVTPPPPAPSIDWNRTPDILQFSAGCGLVFQ